jgi:predicted deacylase
MFNIDIFYRTLIEQAKRLGILKQILGYAETYPIYYFNPLFYAENNFLIATGFHGDEQSGPLGALAFLMSEKSNADMNYALLPMVNPTGFINNTRNSRLGGNPNRGYTEPKIERTKNDPISIEGMVLKNNLNLFLDSSKRGCISLHEDPEMEDFYLYSTMSNDGRNASICEALKQEAKNFGCKITPKKNILGDKVEDGIIYNVFDGSFEHLLVNHGVPLVITVEVPTNFGTLEARTILSRKLIERFRLAIE